MNPSTGTFISMDSYQGSVYDPVTLHKYLYANANPVMYTDPSGYTSQEMLEYEVTQAGFANLSGAWNQADQVALRIFAKIRGVGHAEILGLSASVKVTEVICNIITNQSCYSEDELIFYVQREILVGADQCALIETKEQAQAYALELVNEKNNRRYKYFNAYSLHPRAMVSLRKGLTLAEAKERIMFWGDVWAVDEASAMALCGVLGGVSSGPTRDRNPNNAMHYHAVMSLDHRHIYFGLDKNLLFVP